MAEKKGPRSPQGSCAPCDQKAANGRPRLSVFRSSKQIYAQVIDDERGVHARVRIDPREGTSGASSRPGHRRGGQAVGSSGGARRAAGVKQVIFDRSGYLYHGRVKALADAARESGLDF
jgi:large subunit ribosomal protein L18